jgi:hypothetical protein
MEPMASLMLNSSRFRFTPLGFNFTTMIFCFLVFGLVAVAFVSSHTIHFLAIRS